MRMQFSRTITHAFLVVGLSLALCNYAHSMQPHIFQACQLVLSRLTQIDFKARHEELSLKMKEYGTFLSSLKLKNNHNLKTEIDKLLSFEPGSAKFYAQATKSIQLLNEVFGDKKMNRSFLEYLAVRKDQNRDFSPDVSDFLETLHNDLLRLTISAKPSPESPEMSSFFHIRSRYRVKHPELRRYALLQILFEQKGSKYKNTRPEHELVDQLFGPAPDDLIRPSGPWDTLISETLLVDGTRFSDEEFSILKGHLLSRNPHEVQNARDLLAVAMGDGYLTTKQTIDVIKYAETIQDINLFRDIVQFSEPKGTVATLLRSYALNQSSPFWMDAMKAMNRDADSATIQHAVDLIEDVANKDVSLLALKTLRNSKDLSTEQKENVQLAWFRHLSNELIPRAELFDSVNWRRGDWSELLGGPLIEKNIATFKAEIAKNPRAALSAVEAGQGLNNFDLIAIAIDGAQGSAPGLRAEILDAIFYQVEAKRLKTTDIEKIKQIFKDHPQDPLLATRQEALNWFLRAR
jgi:hypothetical protein